MLLLHGVFVQLVEKEGVEEMTFWSTQLRVATHSTITVLQSITRAAVLSDFRRDIGKLDKSELDTSQNVGWDLLFKVKVIPSHVPWTLESQRCS